MPYSPLINLGVYPFKLNTCIKIIGSKKNITGQQNATTIISVVDIPEVIKMSDVQFERIAEETLKNFMDSKPTNITPTQMKEILQERQERFESQFILADRKVSVIEERLRLELSAIREFVEDMLKDKYTRKRLKPVRGEIETIMDLLKEFEEQPIAFFRKTVDDLEEDITYFQRLDELIFTKVRNKEILDRANILLAEAAKDMLNLSSYIHLRTASENSLHRLEFFMDKNKGILGIFLI